MEENIECMDAPEELLIDENEDKNRLVCLSTQKPKGEDKWTSSNIQNDIIVMVEKLSKAQKLESTFPEFFGNLRSYRYSSADPIVILQVDDQKQVSIIPKVLLHAQMGRFYRLLFEKRYKGQAISLGTQKATTEAINNFFPSLSRDEILPFAFSNENKYCWRKFDWKLLSQEVFGFRHAWNQDLGPDSSLTPHTVAWDEFLALFEEYSPAWHSVLVRTKNAQAFAAWLGSLMVKDCKNTQYLYLQGEGNDSKGSIINALVEIFGEKLSHVENIPKPETGQARFFGGSLEGKRLVASPETNPAYLFTDWFKGFTGGDRLVVEKKGEQTRNSVNYSRFIAAGNPLPDMEMDEATSRRIILVAMTPVPREERIVDFHKKLMSEANFFFSVAYYVYKNMPKENAIEQDWSVYKANFERVNEDLIDQLEDVFWITIDSEGKFKEHEGPKKDFAHMTNADFMRYLEARLPRVPKKRVVETLERVYNTGRLHQIDLGYRARPKCRIGISPKYLNPNTLLLQPDEFNKSKSHLKTIPN